MPQLPKEKGVVDNKDKQKKEYLKLQKKKIN